MTISKWIHFYLLRKCIEVNCCINDSSLMAYLMGYKPLLFAFNIKTLSSSSKQRGSLTDKTVTKNTYTKNQKETATFTWTYKEE